MFANTKWWLLALLFACAPLAAQTPELDVTRGATPIADGGADMPPGTVTAGATFPLTYTLTNSGTGTLNVGASGSSTPVNCTVTITTMPAATVTPSSNTFFAVNVKPTIAGAFSFTLNIASDDANENPYDWTFSGTATGGGGGGGGTSGGGGGGGGCSTEQGSAWWLLLAVLPAIVWLRNRSPKRKRGA